MSELENSSVKIAMNSSAARMHQQTLETSNNLNIEQCESLVDFTKRTDSKTSLLITKLMIKILHLIIVLICLCSSAYTATKFAFVLNINADKARSGRKLSMDHFYFSMLSIEMVFSFIQLLMSLCSWKFMHLLIKNIQKELNASESAKSQKKKKINLKRLIALSYPERFLIIMAFAMLLASSITNIVVPFFFGSVIDSAINYPDLSEMNKYIFFMFFMYFFGSIAGGIRSWLFEVAGQRFVARLRLKVFTSIIKQDIEFFDSNRTGELTSRISSDTQVLQIAVTTNLSMFAYNSVQIIGSILLMLTLEPTLTGIL